MNTKPASAPLAVSLDEQPSTTPVRRRLSRRAPAPLALEPRVMFDGATADAAVAAAKAAASDAPVERPTSARADTRAVEQVPAAVLAPAGERHEILFIEDNVQDFQQLAAQAAPGVEVVVLDHTKDGLQQMIAALDGHAPVDAIHLVSHGLQGQLDLGTARVSGANLDGFGAAFARLGQSLTADGDILIYGCEVGQGAAGADFLGRLATLTGADIAASTDTTGAAVFGGDWTLEAHSGSVETRALDFPGYAGELGVLTVSSVGGDNYVNNAEKASVTVSGTVSNSGQDVQLTVTDGVISRNFSTQTTSSNWSLSVDLSAFSDGTLTMYVKQANAGPVTSAGAEKTVTFTKDTVAPDTAIASNPGSSSGTTASFGFSGSDNNSYQYMLDNSNNWIATTSSLTLNGLSETSHTLSVRALDAAGNVDGTPASYNWTVQHTNSAPVASGNAVLAPVGQLATNPAGATVSSLFGSHYSDVDNDQLAGIAITAYTPDASAGRWEVNSGSGWTALGAVSSASSAIVVKASDSLRFVPSGSYIGNAPALNAKVVEAGLALSTGATLDASGGGGTSHISAGAIRLTTSVKPSYNLATPDSQFMTLLSGSKYDPVDDTQSNAADTDLVGTTGTPLLLGGYDVDTRTMVYRVRIGDPTLSKGVPVFTGVVLLGVDTDGDGKLDIFLGVDGRNSGLGVVTYAPGSDANVSPSTTSITAQQSVNGASNHDYSYTLTGGNVGNDSKPDAWLTFKLPFDVLAARVSALKGQTITPTSSLGFVLLTLTQNNSINGDIGGIGALSKAQSATTWKDLGLLLPLNLSAPTLSDIGGNVQYVENGSPLALAPAASFNDFDSTDFSGGKLEVTISGNLDAGKDLLSLSGGRVTAANGVFSVDGTQVGTYTFASSVLTVNFTAATVSADQVTAVLRAVGFSNSSDTPSPQNRTVQFKLTDGDANASAASTVTVLVQAVDDAPTIAGAQTALDRTVTSKTAYTTTSANNTNALILAQNLNTGLSVNDVDAGTAQVSVTLSVDKGVLQLYNASALQGSASTTIDGIAFSGSGGGALVMTGSLANINAFLAGTNATAIKVIYQPGLSGSAPAVLTLTVNDQGNSGSGGPRTAAQKVGSISIASPGGTSVLAGSVTEDLNLSGGNLVASGALSATINTGGISFAGNTLGGGALGTLSGAGSATWTYTLNDSLATVQALADGQTIQESFAVATVDGTVYVRITIAGVNDKPTLTASATSAAYTENGSATALFSGAAATFGAGETGQGFSSLSLNVTNVFDGDQLVVDGTVIALDKASSGVLTAGGYTVSVSQSGTTSSISIGMLDASAANLQTLVNGIAFQSGSENPTSYGTNASRVFTITALQDNGGTNNGGQNTAALSLVRTLAITAVNDAPVLNVAPLVLNQNSSIAVDAGTLSANDPDTLKPGLVYTVTGAPAKGTLLLNGVTVTGSTTFTQADVDAGKLSYRANAFATAQTDAFTVQVSDGAATASKTVGIDIITTNYAPATEDGRVATNEDVGYVFVPGDFVFRDANTGDALSAVELYSLPNKGRLQVLDNGSWTDASAHQQVSASDISNGKLRFLPAQNEFGTGYASFSFKVIDKAGAPSGDAVMTVDVAPVNDAPVASNLAITMPEDSVKSGTLPVAVDPEGDSFTYAKGSNGTHGTVTVAANGSYTYTPSANFNGLDAFTYTVSDGQASNSYTVTVSVTPVNEAPLGANGSLTTAEDTAKQGSLPGATDIDGDTIVYAKTGNPSHGTVVVAADGSYTYTPEANYNGSDSFTYSIDDQHGGVVGYTMNVTVTPVNDAPTASDTAIGTLEDTAKTGQLPAASDIENDPVTYAKASNPLHGTVSVTGSGGYTYTPAANFNGTDSFTYTVSDGSKSSTYTVTVTVDPVNDAPTASDGMIATLQNSARTGTLPAASDIEHDPVSYSKASDPAHGTVTVDAAGNYTYTPNTGYVGSDIFTYSVSDGDKSTTYKIDVTVGAGNHAPLGQDSSITTLEDNAKQGTLPLASDPDGDTVTYAKLAGPSKGTLLIGSDGSYTYTPDADYNGLDTFTYTVSDGLGGSNTYKVDVTVTPVNDAPTAANTSIATLEDTAKTGQLPVAHDVEGTAVTYAKGSNPAHGTVSVSGSGGYTYTPDANFNGIDSFTYTVSDGDKSSSHTVAVTVDPVNDAPTAGDGAIATLENVTKTGSLPAATDIEHDPIAYAKASEPQHGTVTVSAAGGYTYTPNEGYVGTDVFTYTVSDGDKSTTYKIDVTVGSGNHAPTAANGSIATLQNIAKSGTLPAASDIDNDPVAYAKASDPQHGTVTVSAAGGYTYTPNEGYVGNDAFTYRVSDGDKSNTYTIAVAVGAGNHAPLGQDSSISTPESTPKSGTLPAAIDADGDQVGYARLAGPSKGTVVIGTGGGYTYTPNAGYTGGDSFTYTVDDGHGGSSSYTVEVTVTPVDHTPVGADTGFHTPEDSTKTGSLPPAPVAGGGTAAYAKASDPQHGSATVSADGRYSYTPNANYNGPDSFTYSVSSGGASNTYTVDITVDPVNDAPTAGDAGASTLEDTAVAGSLPGASDIDGDKVAYRLAVNAQHGSASVDADGRFSYTPAKDYNGSDSFRYSVDDGKGGSNTYTVTVTVEPVNDAPVAHGGASGKGTVGEPMTPVTVPPFTDVDSPVITYTAALADGKPLPDWLSFDPATLRFIGTPPGGSVGSYAVTLTGSDGKLSDSTTVTITVANPPAPSQSVAIAAMGKDTGASPTDFVTNDGSAGRTVTGSIGAPLGRNEVVQVSFDGGGTWSTAATSGTSWSIVDGGAHGGNWTIAARVTNTVAGLSGASAAREVVLDTVAPAAPDPDDVTTTVTTPRLTGTATLGQGETLRVTVNGASYELPAPGGSWTLDLASATPLSGGTPALEVGRNYEVMAVVTDLAGNTRSGSGTLSISAPVVPSAPAPVAVAPAAAPLEPVQPSPVLQAAGSGVRATTDTVVPGSVVGGDTLLFGAGQGARASEQAPAIDLRGAELSDVYTRSEGFRTVVAKAEEPALVVFQGVPDQFVETGAALSMTVPADAFAHTQPKAIVRLVAVQQDGRALPGWVQFNSQTGQFTGDVPKGQQGELKVKLVARDMEGREATALFRINVGQQRMPQGDKAAPAGKPGLSQQLRGAQARR